MPVLIELDRFGKGKIICSKNSIKCKKFVSGIAQFTVSFSSDLSSNYHQQVNYNNKAIESKISKELSKCIASGSYRMNSISKKIKQGSNDIKRFIDEDIYTCKPNNELIIQKNQQEKNEEFKREENKENQVIVLHKLSNLEFSKNGNESRLRKSFEGGEQQLANLNAHYHISKKLNYQKKRNASVCSGRDCNLKERKNSAYLDLVTAASEIKDLKPEQKIYKNSHQTNLSTDDLIHEFIDTHERDFEKKGSTEKMVKATFPVQKISSLLTTEDLEKLRTPFFNLSQLTPLKLPRLAQEPPLQANLKQQEDKNPNPIPQSHSPLKYQDYCFNRKQSSSRERNMNRKPRGDSTMGTFEPRSEKAFLSVLKKHLKPVRDYLSNPNSKLPQNFSSKLDQYSPQRDIVSTFS